MPDRVQPCCSSAATRDSRLIRQLRERIRDSLVSFLQAVLDAPENREHFESLAASDTTAQRLWRDGLLLVYRLVFILRLEAVCERGTSFGFIGTPAWRTHYSLAAAAQILCTRRNDHPNEASLVERVHRCCSCFVDGMPSDGLRILPLGGGLFDRAATTLLDSLHWDEATTGALLLALTWQNVSDKGRARVEYAQLEVEDLGGIYEGLLELQPGITREPMCRMRRARLDVMVPRSRLQARAGSQTARVDSKLTSVEEIPAHRFYLCVGFARKATGSFYTPREFVRYLTRETLEPAVLRLSPANDPNPCALLELKVLDPTMGSGHFLVEACRYLGQAVYDAYLRCESLAAIEAAEAHPNRAACLRARADEFRRLDPAVTQPDLDFSRALVAKRCLYGVDRNPLAAELARVALWLTCTSETLSLDQLSRHLVTGEALTGPRLAQLLTLPRAGTRIEAADPASLSACLREPTGIPGRGDVPNARATAVRRLAAAWTGSVMLGNRADDDAYWELFWSVLRGDDGFAVIERHPILRKAIDLGRDGVVYELTFADVFDCATTPASGGFDAILGNPPWDAIKFNTKEFLAEYDLGVLEAPTKKERDRIEARLTQSSDIAERFREYQESFERLKRTNDRNFSHQKLMIDGDLAGRQLDLYRVVLERACQLLKPTGYLGMVVPSSFHTAAGAVGVRRLIAEQHRLLRYLSFVNRRKNFDISVGIEFGLLVAAGLGTAECPTQARFGLEDPQLLQTPERLALLNYPIESLCRGNPYLTFPTAGDEIALSTLAICRSSGKTLQELLHALQIELRSTPTSVHMTHEAKHFIEDHVLATLESGELTARYQSAERGGDVLLHEGGTFARFSDLWGQPPRFRLSSARVASSERWRTLATKYKIALRAIVGSAREKSIAALLPPGCLVANSALVEAAPERRRNADALALVGLLNTTTISWLLCFYADLNVNLFALKYLPVPSSTLPTLLAHHSLRLCCNHAAYAPLWQEMLGDRWREDTRPLQWPALESQQKRTAARAEMDAVVAHWYGLTRRRYATILGAYEGFNGPETETHCLEAYDRVAKLGPEDFAKQVDPYWDVR